MDALNFLQQTPLTNWLDFYVNPKTFLHYESVRRSDPPVVHLIGEFCDRARMEERLMETAPTIEHMRLRYKRNKLWMLAFLGCSKMNWDVVKLNRTMTAVNICTLMERLLQFSSETPLETAESILVSCAGQKWVQLTPQLRHALFVYSKWCLSLDVKERKPSPPVRPTVSNPHSQHDPVVASDEANKASVSLALRCASTSFVLLENCLHNFSTLNGDQSGSVLVTPLPQCFLPPKDDEHILPPDVVPEPDFYLNDNFEPAPIDRVRFEIHYQLLASKFADMDFTNSRIHLQNATELLSKMPHDDAVYERQRATLYGYSLALSVPPTKALSSVTSHKPTILPSSSLVLSYSRRHHALKSDDVSLDEILTNLDFLPTCSEWAIRLAKSAAGMERLVLALKRKVLSCSTTSTKASISKYCNYLAWKIGADFQAAADKLGLITALGDGSKERWAARRSSDDDLALKATLSPSQLYIDNGPSEWELLVSFDAAVLKRMLSYSQPYTVPQAYTVPATLDSLVPRFTSSVAQDYVLLLLGKMNQLAELARTDTWQKLALAFAQEAKATGSRGTDQLTAALTFEALRIELTRWHRRIGKERDVRLFGETTANMAEQARSYVQTVVGSRPPAPPSATMGVLVSAFFINSNDWDFLIGNNAGRFQSRFMDLARMLAAFRHAIDNNDTETLGQVADTFFKVMLSTMEDPSMPPKDASKRRRIAEATENTRQLLNRKQLASIVALIKEQTTISLLLSFFGKLFNVKYNGMHRLFTEYGHIWPSSYRDASNINDGFLLDMISITLQNGLQINPTNAFWLRLAAEFVLVKDDVLRSRDDTVDDSAASSNCGVALQHYLEALVSCTYAFAKPFPENVVDDTLLSNMMKCLARLNRPTEQALVAQLLQPTTSDGGHAAVATKALAANPSDDSLYPLLYEPNLLEFLIDSLERQQQAEKLTLALRQMHEPELNCHNSSAVLDAVRTSRRRRLLLTLCHRHF